jgi:phosphatidylglycerophosphate synthase
VRVGERVAWALLAGWVLLLVLNVAFRRLIRCGKAGIGRPVAAKSNRPVWAALCLIVAAVLQFVIFGFFVFLQHRYGHDHESFRTSLRAGIVAGAVFTVLFTAVQFVRQRWRTRRTVSGGSGPS